ncbi:MAG: lysophospholipid acyltransferase family protein [Nanoarchaeota archaeon]
MAYPISKWIVPPIYKLWLRKIEGWENVPKDKSFIIAVNHTSYYDALLIPCIIISRQNRQFRALVNSFYWKNIITKFFLNLWGGIPVYVDKEVNAKKNNQEYMKKVLQSLDKGEIVIIFPEGRRSKDGKLQKAYTGVAKIALKAKVPVLPVAIIDANKVLPVGKVLPRFKRCEVKFGKPIYFNKYYNIKSSEKIFVKITRSIMKEIAKLIGQKYNY